MSSAAECLVRMTEIDGRGRGLVATQPLQGGQVILRDSPILLYSGLPLINQQSSYCDRCFRTLTSTTSTSRCPSCSVVFCNPNCMREATSCSHSPYVCQALSRLRNCPELLSQSVECQLQARFLIAAYNLALYSPSQFQTLMSLQGTATAADANAHFLHSVISSICPPPPSSLQFQICLELTAALLAKDGFNAFGLMEPIAKTNDGERSVRAYGIYPMASFFNHDCLPNACRFDYVDSDNNNNNTDIIIRVIHDVPQGREICLSYFPVNLDYSSRQKRLLEDYGFTCDCDRCKVEANWSDDNLNNEDDDNEELMDEDQDEQMVASDNDNDAENEDTDFPHAYFFLRYMCNKDNCWGTLAPLPPGGATPSTIMECNACGNLKKDEVIA